MAEKTKKRVDGRYQTAVIIDGKRKLFFGKMFKEAIENKNYILKQYKLPHM